MAFVIYKHVYRTRVRSRIQKIYIFMHQLSFLKVFIILMDNSKVCLLNLWKITPFLMLLIISKISLLVGLSSIHGNSLRLANQIFNQSIFNIRQILKQPLTLRDGHFTETKLLVACKFPCDTTCCWLVFIKNHTLFRYHLVTGLSIILFTSSLWIERWRDKRWYGVIIDASFKDTSN